MQLRMNIKRNGSQSRNWFLSKWFGAISMSMAVKLGNNILEHFSHRLLGVGTKFSFTPNPGAKFFHPHAEDLFNFLKQVECYVRYIMYQVAATILTL